MRTQRELFETEQSRWVHTVWLSIPTAVRREICTLLAQMATTAVGGRQPAAHAEEARDE